MARIDDSQGESLASADEVNGSEDLPGELLADDLVEPEAYVLAEGENEAEELTDADEGEPDSVAVDETQLSEATSVAQAARSSRPRRREPSDAVAEPPARKGKATPRRTGKAVAAQKRTTPAVFAKESVEELKKVIWPSGQQVRQYFSVVLVFVIIVIAFVGLLDFLFGLGLLKFFG